MMKDRSGSWKLCTASHLIQKLYSSQAHLIQIRPRIYLFICFWDTVFVIFGKQSSPLYRHFPNSHTCKFDIFNVLTLLIFERAIYVMFVILCVSPRIKIPQWRSAFTNLKWSPIFESWAFLGNMTQVFVVSRFICIEEIKDQYCQTIESAVLV